MTASDDSLRFSLSRPPSAPETDHSPFDPFDLFDPFDPSTFSPIRISPLEELLANIGT